MSLLSKKLLFGMSLIVLPVLNRSYQMLAREWISYMKHLKDNFPYLFSLAMRTNPFDQDASVIVVS